MTETIKVSELTGVMLDYWVARAEGINTTLPKYGPILRADNIGGYYRPSRDWSQGGPIIEREKINTSFCDEDWFAQLAGTGPRDDSPNYLSAGRTPLEAAMRCYVASKATPEQIAEWVKETRG